MQKKKVVEAMAMSYTREMGNPETHETENELIVLLPVGCYWAKKHGACSYCGYQPLVDRILNEYEKMELIDLVKYEVNRQEEPFQRISFFVGGSFFEIPPEKRIEIFKYVNTLGVNEVFIETRPEFINTKNVTELRDLLDNKTFWIAIGLESRDEKIRNEVHRKGIPEKTFLNAMQVLKETGIHPLVYVFFKPPLENISDREAFEDAMETIKYSFRHGAAAVEIESGYIVENSYMKKLYDAKKYTPLKLWTIQHLLKEANKLNLGIVRIAYFTDTPAPIDGPANCDRCNEQMLELLQGYRMKMEQDLLYEEVDCQCKKEWQEEFFSNPGS
jgi:radical SAM enzyme (TIGR01210 family)